jgi:hypothetical protein
LLLLVAPKNTPIEIIDNSAQRLRQLSLGSKVNERLSDLGAIAFAARPLIRQVSHAEIEKWGTVIRAANMNQSDFDMAPEVPFRKCLVPGCADELLDENTAFCCSA